MLTAPQLQAIQTKIKHVIVLMMENRSFDHMLGYSNITGKIAGTNQQGFVEGIDPENPPFNPDNANNPVYSAAEAPFILDLPDPGHDFADVMRQLTGDPNAKLDQTGCYPTKINNSGFVQNYQNQKNIPADPSVIMKAFSPDKLPILTQLAREFVVCDHWFSSMPGPTWPNRFFVHAATSGGLDDSPSLGQILIADTFKGFKFDKGTIFNCLSEHRINWTIYAGSKFPQVLALKGIRANDIIAFADLKIDIQKPGFPAYTFIEPNYGHFLQGNYLGGNSQHPLDDVTSGERLMKEVYETIRNSSIWEESILVITYDEHGGFYDHIIPPLAEDPGDSKHYTKNHFNFKQYGIRVPSIIISPLIEKNLIDKRTYDHTSILASLEKLFGIGHLTERDQLANNFLDLISLDSPRDTPSKLVEAGVAVPMAEPAPVPANEALDSSLTGFLHVAYIRDLEVSTPAERAKLPDKLMQLDDREKALTYMHEVKPKLQE
ncbi:MAG TPA: alkaline phosphatase family protein [Puia sp.]|nr:alkaline phosphatase family protein [Puia sp.]